MVATKGTTSLTNRIENCRDVIKKLSKVWAKYFYFKVSAIMFKVRYRHNIASS